MNCLGNEVDEAAAAWDARLRGTNATHHDRLAFQEWLQQDEQHQLAYDRLQAALRALRSQADLPELSALRDEARNSVHASRRRRYASVLSIAAGLAAIIVIAEAIQVKPANRVFAELQREKIYSTKLHEQTRVTLADGSLVTLDSGTQLAVRLSSVRRDVRLLGGRALFKVAKDSERPFVVKAGDRSITALGTMFDVRVTPRELRVTLAEGSVAVRPLDAGHPLQPQILRPRQQLVAVAGSAQAVLRVVDIDNALAWADRQFFFEDEPLISAVDEVNRYADVKILVDPDVANLRINGMFRVSDQTAFVEALKSTLPVDVRKDAQGRLVVSRSVGIKASAARVAAM